MAYENKPLVKTNMAYGNKPFVKIKNGVKAPSGFHYMSNGKLMSDADHTAIHGYIEQKITSFNANTQDILNGGETRLFTIRGNKDAVFSLEIYDNTGKYYNFNSNTWVTDKVKLSKKVLNRAYTVRVVFDALPDSSLKTYTVNLFAETVQNIKTIHAPFVDYRNADNSINVNKTTGSNSNILTKIIYQDTLKTLKLSCVAPSLYNTSAGTIDGATSDTKPTIDQDATNSKICQVGDKITTTGIASSIHALITKVNPDGDNVNEIQMSVTDTTTDGAAVTFTPPFNGMTPHDDDSDANVQTISVSSGNSSRTAFSITLAPLSGRTFNVIKTPTIDDLCAYTTVTFGSAALAIDGENTGGGDLFYRWPITNIANLRQGMILDPARTGTGVNTLPPASISNYRTTTTKEEIKESDYDNYIKSVTVDDVLVDAIDAYGNDVTAVDRNGRITAQEGNIVFNRQQPVFLNSDAGVRIFAYGASGIETLTGAKIKLNITSMAYAGSVNPIRAAASTTTSSAVSASTTIPLAEVGKISQGMVIRGVGIDPSVANPTVVSKNAVSGAGNVIASVAQTLEDGQTLYFDGGATTITIRGNIEVSNMAINDIDLFFDVEKFLTAV